MKLTNEKVKARVGGVWDASEIRAWIAQNPEQVTVKTGGIWKRIKTSLMRLLGL